MGWRTTAQNLNLNRDYVKADAPEMQAMLRAARTSGIRSPTSTCTSPTARKFEHDVSINVEPTLAGDEALRQAGGRACATA